MVYEFRYGLGYENGNLKKKLNHSPKKHGVWNYYLIVGLNFT